MRLIKHTSAHIQQEKRGEMRSIKHPQHTYNGRRGGNEVNQTHLSIHTTREEEEMTSVKHTPTHRPYYFNDDLFLGTLVD